MNLLEGLRKGLDGVLGRNGNGTPLVLERAPKGPLVLRDGPYPQGRPPEGEIGATGTAFFSGYIDTDEYNANLTGTTGAETYNKMRRDPQVGATVKLINLPIRAAKWTFEAGELKDDDTIKSDPTVELAVKEQMRQRLKWDRLLNDLLEAVVFGYWVGEKVWSTDGQRMWIDKVAHRSPLTIQKWHTDDGELAGITQQSVWKDGSFRTLTTPEAPSKEEAAWKLVHMAIDMHGDNFEGISMLRGAYGPWFARDMIFKIACIGVERFAIGVPIAEEVETGGFSGVGGINTSDAQSAVKTILKNLRAGHQAYIIQPRGYKIGILGHPGEQRIDPMPLISYCDLMIAMNTLAMAIKLGSTDTGSRALGDSFFGIFMLALEGIANLIGETVTEQIVRPFVAANFPGADGIALKTRWSDLRVTDPKQIATYVQQLALGGFITADDELENHLRSIGNMPPMPEGDDLDEAAVRNPTDLAAARRWRRKLRGLRVRGLAREERTYWRPLRPEEMMLDLSEIEDRQDAAVAEVVAVAEDAKAAWAEALADQAVEALRSGDPAALEAVAVPDDLRDAAAEELDDVVSAMLRFGEKTVRDERRRARSGRARASRRAYVLREPLSDEQVDALMKTSVRAYLDRLSGRVRSLAVERARAIFRTVGEEITDAQVRQIVADVQTFFAAAAETEAQALIAEAVGAGRDQSARALEADIRHAVYSAILDGAVCEECAGADGETVTLGSADYDELTPPNRLCLSANSGSNKCRCLWAYVFREDT